MRRITLALTTAAALFALAAPTFAATSANTLTGTDGPGFTITMSKKTVTAGTYVITIHDRSAIHNFHLTGPGVDKLTSVPAVGHHQVDGEAEEGHLPVRVRPPYRDHARGAEGHMSRPKDLGGAR